MNPDTFNQKLYNTYELIVRNELQAAYLSINQLVGKKKSGGKGKKGKKGKKAKKKKLSDEQENVIRLLEAMCFTKDSRYGEAKKVMKEYFSDHETHKDDDAINKNMISFLSINLELQNEAMNFFEKNYKTNPEGLDSFLKFSINAFDFKKIQTLLMKRSKVNKESSEVDFLASIFIQFLNFKKVSDEFLRDKPDGKLLKILIMFCKKSKMEISKVKDATLKKKLTRDLIELEILLGEAMGNNEPVLKIIGENLEVFEYTEHIDIYLRLINEAKEGVKVDILLNCIEGFLNTLNLEFEKDNPVANYDRQFGLLETCNGMIGEELSNKFLEFFGEENDKDLSAMVDFMLEKGAEDNLKEESFYVQYFYQNCRFLKKFALREKPDKFRSKNNILLLLNLLYFVSKYTENSEKFQNLFKKIIEDLVKLYTDFYKKTASILPELYPLLKNYPLIFESVESRMTELLENEESPDIQSRIDFHLFQLKLLKSGEFLDRSKEENLKLFKECLEKFKTYEEKIYGDVEDISVKKGERLKTDSWLQLLIEFIRCLEATETQDQEKIKLKNTLLALISFAKRTPYNFDITLREAELNNKLCLSFENDELFKLKDLKGNQYDTLSYIFYKNDIMFGDFGSGSENIASSESFYRKQHRDNPSAFKHAIKHCNLKTIHEFYIFDRLALNSQFRSVLNSLKMHRDLVEYCKSKKTDAFKNFKFYVERNLPLVAKENIFAFNYDLPLLQPDRFLTSNLYFNDFLGSFGLFQVHNSRFLTTAIFGFLTEIKQKKIDDDVVENLRKMFGLLDENINELEKKDTDLFGLDYENYYIMRRINDPFKNLDKNNKQILDEKLAIEELLFTSKILKTFSKILKFYGFFFSADSKEPVTTLEDIDLTELQNEIENLWKIFDANKANLFGGKIPLLSRDLLFQNFFILTNFVLLYELNRCTKNSFKNKINSFLKKNEFDNAKEFSTFLKGQKEILKTKILEMEIGFKELADTEFKPEDFSVIDDIQNEEFLEIEKSFESYLKKFRNMLRDKMAKIGIYAKSIN